TYDATKIVPDSDNVNYEYLAFDLASSGAISRWNLETGTDKSGLIVLGMATGQYYANTTANADTLLGTLNFKVLDNCTSGEIRVGLNQDFSADNPYGLAAGKKNLISLSDESALSNMDFTQTATSMV